MLHRVKTVVVNHKLFVRREQVIGVALRDLLQGNIELDNREQATGRIMWCKNLRERD
jgi:hypothetical protein